jgi:hypothetical protein
MTKRDEEQLAILLTKGSKYRIASVETREKPMVTHGIFRGYTAIGSAEGICIEMDESHKESAGRIRIIPTHMVVSIDVIELAKEEEKAKPSEAMYG